MKRRRRKKRGAGIKGRGEVGGGKEEEIRGK